MVSKWKPYAGVAHPVERHLAKVEVASSSLVTRSSKKLQASGLELFSLHIRRILHIAQEILHSS